MKIATADTVRRLVELEATAEELMNRHLTAAREWFPHQYVPWSLGRDFDGPLDGEPWHPGQSALGPALRSALVVNLLTEDNLPAYHWIIGAQTSRDGAWGSWLHQWTAEEDRHASALRGYLHATRAVDPVVLAVAGDYDPRVHHDEVLVPLLRALRVHDLAGLGPAGEQARDRIASHVEQLDARAARFVERRARTLAVRARRAGSA